MFVHTKHLIDLYRIIHSDSLKNARKHLVSEEAEIKMTGTRWNISNHEEKQKFGYNGT